MTKMIFDERPEQIPERDNTSFGAPHIILLGAGASKAAFPNGDLNGKEVPLTKDIPRVCNLIELDPQLKDIEDFESYFSDLKDPALRNELEHRIREYFSSLLLPEEATLYDYLALSFRAKDIIATFNWDPFLYQAFNVKDPKSRTLCLFSG